MRRTIFFLFCVGIFGAIAWLSLSVLSIVSERKAVSERVQFLPSTTWTSLNGHHISVNETTKQGTILLFFTTTCPFCRTEIEDLINDIDRFIDTRIVLLSGEPQASLAEYATELGINGVGNIEVVVDEGHSLASHFGIERVPTTFVYSADGRLLDRFDGMVHPKILFESLVRPSPDSQSLGGAREDEAAVLSETVGP